MTHVVLLRTPQQPVEQDPYRLAFIKAFSAAPLILPILSLSFTNQAGFASLIERGPKERYAGVIVTSARAAEAWETAQNNAQAFEVDSSLEWKSVPFFVCGKATKKALHKQRRLGLEEDEVFGEETGTGEKLAHFILDFFQSRGKPDLPLLCLVGDKNKKTIQEILAKEDIEVERFQVYGCTTTCSFEHDLDQVLLKIGYQSLDAGSTKIAPTIDVWFALFSPSGARPCISALRNRGLLPPPTNSQTTSPSSYPTTSTLRIHLAAIGPVTRDYVKEEEHLEIEAMAEKPTPEDLVKAILNAN